jgi:ubiquinone/menaquinone biosynthesis C-methylase UbiE
MDFILYIRIGLVCIIILIAAIWRLSSRRLFTPCPVWLAWLLELDNPFLKNNRASEIIRHMDLRSGMQVLDFGCGPGRLTIPVARQIGPQGSVTAFDLQPEMLERVRAKATQGKLENIVYVQGAAGDGKLGTDKYDRAILVTVLGEIPDKKKAMQEIFDSLKPGGLLTITEVIADPHFQTRKKVSALASASGFRERAFFGNWIAYTLNLEKP